MLLQKKRGERKKMNWKNHDGGLATVTSSDEGGGGDEIDQ